MHRQAADAYLYDPCDKGYSKRKMKIRYLQRLVAVDRSTKCVKKHKHQVGHVLYVHNRRAHSTVKVKWQRKCAMYM